MAEQASESPILDLLMTMNVAGVEASSLDPQSLMLVRMAALVAVDAPPVSYMLNLRVAGDVNVDAEDVEGMLAAIAPIVGSARVASAAGKMVRALGIELSLAELDEAEPRAS
jgi:4-carboxymuconolactone decarboxylase